MEKNEERLLKQALECYSMKAREEFLNSACGENAGLRQRLEARLRASDPADDDLSLDTVEEETMVDEATHGDVPSEGAGTVIGHYQLLEKIGEGGFGLVYMAQQSEPVKRRVALKIIKLGMDTRQVVARFEAERQALALMDHPNIAMVHDGGSTDTGRPYFVMELVRGVPITEFCDENKLTVGERLNLFLSVCSAIEHAHQKGIIHRDIKPSNVLVALHDEIPVPKVIDFGIAKATQQALTEKTVFTRFQQFMGTPAYMSPEQATMSGLDLDTRSDIYSLGVLLYELLAGKTPFDPKKLSSDGYDEIRRRIQEDEPLKPSARVSTMEQATLLMMTSTRRCPPEKLKRALRGELDWVVMKAMEKDRNRRYDTANAFRLDIQRFLNHEPVEAVAPSPAYRFKKFIRRQRVALAFGAVLLFAAGFSTERAFRARTALLESQKQETIAKETARVRRRELYAAEMNLAINAIEKEEYSRAAYLVSKQRPKLEEEELRGFEWNYLWQRCQSDETFVFSIPNDKVTATAFSPDGRKVASRTAGGRIKVFDLTTKGSIAVTSGLRESNQRESVTYSPDGKWLAVHADEAIQIYETRSWQLGRKLDVKGLDPSLNEDAWLAKVRFSKDGQYLAGRVNHGVSLWDTRDWSKQWTLSESDGRFGAQFEFFHDRPLLAVSEPSKSIRVVDLATGKTVREIGDRIPPLFTMAISPQDDVLVGSNWGRPLEFWDIETGRSIKRIRAHTKPILGLSFSRGGDILATAGREVIHLSQVQVQERIGSLVGHQ